MTRARQQVLATLEAANSPLSAQAVRDSLGCSVCDQATVYRALAYLEEQGLAESFVLHCKDHGTERYYSAGHGIHRHWFHCESCHRFVDLGSCRLGTLVAELEEEHAVSVHSHALYLSGLCSRCRAQPH